MIRLFLVFVFALVVFDAAAQNTATTMVPASAEATGVINEYTPGSTLVLDAGTGMPVSYQIGKNVTFADKDGKKIEAAGLRKNLRVRVHFVEQGANRVVDKITIAE
ncbi:MAG: hypothetical protein M3R59_10315 [Verrucomicrobiota bacterium]|nr:hypothetical protein [Verrucomicrobiota bacterium]